MEDLPLTFIIYCIIVVTTLLDVLCDNVFICLLVCVFRIIINGYLLNYLP